MWFITFFYITVSTHVTELDVCVTQKAKLCNIAAVIVQIYISCEEKHFYIDGETSTWFEGDVFTVIFLGYACT